MGSRLAVSITASALVGGLGVGLFGLTQQVGHDVLIVDRGQVTVITMWGGQVGDALAWAKVPLRPGDQVRPGVDQPVSDGVVVVVDRLNERSARTSEQPCPSPIGFVPAVSDPSANPPVSAVVAPLTPEPDQPADPLPAEDLIDAVKGPVTAEPPADQTPASNASPSARPTTPAAPAAPAATQPPATQPPADPPPAAPVNSCRASYYNQGRVTANGEAFNPQGLTAAHRTLPFNTRVLVTNPANGLSVVVRINDRGPFIEGRCLDLAEGAFRQIAALSQGVVTVQWQVI
ncbi:MAG: septal ring lytic transglycosylase RlpA family protein [Propionibacteriaceae bacterium]|jgi:rare lipoprotein A|nr:septal ring lytic transglycosylase RlpA family protein [Propionibacteriaceae bacterium]